MSKLDEVDQRIKMKCSKCKKETIHWMTSKEGSLQVNIRCEECDNTLKGIR